MKPSDKCTNNTGFSFSSGNGTSFGWDSNGTPCSINANKPTTTSIGSYYPNVSSGYNATARSYIGGLDDRFEPFKLTESTNPYLNQSSSFPTFNPPQLPLPQPFSDQLSSNENHNGSGYSLTAIQNLPRIATDTEFAATGHGNIAVESIVHHAVQQNSTGKGINAIASLQMINLSYNKLNDNDLFNLNTGLIGYTLNLKVFNLSYNNFGDAGIDYLIKGLAGVQYLQAGGRELSGVMQGLFTHYNVNITTINLSNNHIGDIGADIISNAIVTNSLPHVKALNLADNNITDTGAAHLADSLKSKGNKLNIIHLEGNRLTSTGEGFLVKALLNKATQHMIIYTQSYKGQFDEHVKMIFGTKEERAVVYKKLIAQGVEKGVNVEAIVVDQTLLGKINNGIDLTTTNIKTFFGFIKCNFDPIDMVKSYATDKIIAKLPKSVSKLMGEIKTTEGAVSCYFEAHNEAWTSEAGLNVLTHELCVTGENGFCGE